MPGSVHVLECTEKQPSPCLMELSFYIQLSFIAMSDYTKDLSLSFPFRFWTAALSEKLMFVCNFYSEFKN